MEMKKKGGILAISAIVLLAVAGLWYVKSRNTEARAGDLAVVQKQAGGAAEPDSDSDGLPDWEEALWHTLPSNPDTDGDGTSDGAEVEARRDPTKRGPNDALPAHAPSSGDGGTAKAYAYSYDPKLGNTPTEKLALNLTSNYLLSSGGQTLTEAEKASLVNNLVADMTKTLPTPRVFALSNLKVQPTTEASLHAYFNALGTILQNASPGGVDEAVIMQSVMTNNNLADLAALKKIGVKFSKASSQIIALSVPERLAGSHLAFANNLAQAGWGLETMGSSDPMLALLGMNAYRNAYTDLTDRVAPTLFAPIISGEVYIDPAESANFFAQ